jgi:DNA-binding transcriptional ArsR family regulator
VSLKRTTMDRGGGRQAVDESAAKIDRQELWDELRRRAEDGEPFTPSDVATNIGAPEAAVSRHLLILAYERLLEKVEGGRYRAGTLKDTTQAVFVKALTAKIDPKRSQDQLEIDRLKKNNDEMRRRLLEAVAERDRLLALLKKHGIDPGLDGASEPK